MDKINSVNNSSLSINENDKVPNNTQTQIIRSAQALKAKISKNNKLITNKLNEIALGIQKKINDNILTRVDICMYRDELDGLMKNNKQYNQDIEDFFKCCMILSKGSITSKTEGAFMEVNQTQYILDLVDDIDIPCATEISSDELCDIFLLNTMSRWVTNDLRQVVWHGGVNLSYINLSGANLSGANLEGADLTFTNLSGANLIGVNFSGADLHCANLSGANLSGANLRFTNLSGANLSYANLNGAYLDWVDIHEANLSGANFSEAYLNESNCSGANLSGANFSEAKLIGGYFDGIKLNGANFSGTTFNISDISRIRLMFTNDLDLDFNHIKTPSGTILTAINSIKNQYKDIKNHLMKQVFSELKTIGISTILDSLNDILFKNSFDYADALDSSPKFLDNLLDTIYTQGNKRELSMGDSLMKILIDSLRSESDEYIKNFTITNNRFFKQLIIKAQLLEDKQGWDEFYKRCLQLNGTVGEESTSIVDKEKL